MTSRRSILILLGLCQLLCVIAVVDPREIYFYIALIAFLLGLLEAAATEEKSLLAIVFVLLSVVFLAAVVHRLFIDPNIAYGLQY